jgi:hypothetical protein
MLASSSDNDSSRIPIVSLPTDVITNVMAARMTMSLLSHVLFLKAQTPLFVSPKHDQMDSS